jgi:hypothetical protein
MAHISKYRRQIDIKINGCFPIIAGNLIQDARSSKLTRREHEFPNMSHYVKPVAIGEEPN